MKKAILPFYFAALASISGCGSTKITDSWRVSEPVEHFPNIIVLALTPANKPLLREELENHMADELCQIGYYTLSAQFAYGKDAFCNMCEAEIFEKLKRDQVDAVLTIALIGRNTEKEFIVKKIPQMAPSSSARLYRYQEEVTQQLLEPGYYATRTYYYWEANLYRVNDQELIYSAVTETVDPGSAADFAKEYGRLIIDDMVRLKVFDAPKLSNPLLQ